MSTLETPAAWRGRPVSTLDLLLFIRQKVREGVVLEMFLGSVNAHAMRAFLEGSSMALQYNGISDQGFADFVVWLRDVKKQWPQDGWVKKFLRESGGDHEVAIKKFLDFAAEFAALKGSASSAQHPGAGP